MKKYFFAIVSAMLAVIMLTTTFPFAVSAKDNSEEFDILGFDTDADVSGITVYPNKTNKDRVIDTTEYQFKNSTLLVFDKNGWLIEAGLNLRPNVSAIKSSVQLSVRVPAGGFLVAFGSGAPAAIKECYQTAIEGAFVHNSTISVIYEVKGSYNENSMKLKIEYDNPKPASENAKKFLCVGNSGTYINGVPIKFKGLARAAGVEVDVVYSTVGGAYLHEFANETHENHQVFLDKLNSQQFDYVVLQDNGSALYDSTNAAVKSLMPLIKENGAEALLYMRFGPNAKGCTTLHNIYSQIAKEQNLVCAPAGDAFKFCLEGHPDINLWADDEAHGSKEASYLIACVWLYSYLGKDPRGNTYTAQLPQDVATTLQELAAQACEAYTASEGNVGSTTTSSGKSTTTLSGKTTTTLNKESTTTLNEESTTTLNEESTTTLNEESTTTTNTEAIEQDEPAATTNKNLTWLYVVIGAVVVAAAVVVAIIIGKKK